MQIDMLDIFLKCWIYGGLSLFVFGVIALPCYFIYMMFTLNSVERVVYLAALAASSKAPDLATKLAIGAAVGTAAAVIIIKANEEL